MNFLMWFLALVVFTMENQLSFGPGDVFEVLISIISPVFKIVFNGTKLPLTVAPIALSPTFV